MKSPLRKSRVCGVVVTRRRSALLKRALEALRRQTRPLDGVVVVDNGSDDATRDWLRAQPDVQALFQGNLGSAGGFAAGLREAVAMGFDWAWCMDDDGFPADDCLARLRPDEPGAGIRNAAVCSEENPERLAFTVFLPGADRVLLDTLSKLREGAKGADFIPGITFPFNGTLIHRSVIERVGLPLADLFLWGDEREFALRAARAGEAGAVYPEALFYHPPDRMTVQETTVRGIPWKVVELDGGTGNLRNFLAARNGAYIRFRYNGWKVAALHSLATAKHYGGRYGLRGALWAVRACAEGVLGRLRGHRRYLDPGESPPRARPGWRRRLSTLLLDWPRMESLLARDALGIRPAWTRIRNRADRLDLAPDGEGVDILRDHGEPLLVCVLHPFTGRRLLRYALKRWPVVFRAGPAERGDELSVIICHRGLQRLSHLQKVLASFAGQESVGAEIVVVEQSETPESAAFLPKWVKYVHQQVPPGEPFNRSAAFNHGAANASGGVLMFHDNDIVVPARWCLEHLRRAEAAADVLQLKRFVFYLDEETTRGVLDEGGFSRPRAETVLQSVMAGCSITLKRRAFEAIGRFDERFRGWGGEDIEFFDRCGALRVERHAYLPAYHLHHPPQVRKEAVSNPNRALLERLLAAPREERIRDLTNPAARLEPEGQS